MVNQTFRGFVVSRKRTHIPVRKGFWESIQQEFSLELNFHINVVANAKELVGLKKTN
jgi:hypothetical protein